MSEAKAQQIEQLAPHEKAAVKEQLQESASGMIGTIQEGQRRIQSREATMARIRAANITDQRTVDHSRQVLQATIADAESYGITLSLPDPLP